MLNRGFSYRSIRGLSSMHLDDQVVKSQFSLSKDLKELSVQEKVAKAYFYGIENKRGANYLTARGIAGSTYQPYIGSSLQVGKSAVFGLYQGLDSYGNGTMCSTISYQFCTDQDGRVASKKYFQKGLSRGLAVLSSAKVAVQRIVITESPIDALSHKQLYREKDSTMYVATCGTISNSIAKEISNILQGASNNNQAVVLAFDGDPAGKKLEKMVEQLAKPSGIQPIKIAVKSGKDWNEQLQQNLGSQTINFLLQLQRSIARDVRSNYSIDDDGHKSRRKQEVHIDKNIGVEL